MTVERSGLPFLIISSIAGRYFSYAGFIFIIYFIWSVGEVWVVMFRRGSVARSGQFLFVACRVGESHAAVGDNASVVAHECLAAVVDAYV